MDDQQTDYCTMFPDKIFSWDISYCCKAHDLAYTLQAPRREADLELFKCVSDSQPYLAFPALMLGCIVYVGVRAFGKYFYNKAAN